MRIPDETKAEIERLARAGRTITEVADSLGISRDTTRSYWPRDVQSPGRWPKGDAQPAARASLPAGVHETPSLPELPDAVPESFEPLQLDRPGTWGVIGDVHLPYHDRTTLELFAGEGRNRSLAGVLINGDLLDSHEISVHDQDPRKERYVREIEYGQKFVAWLRGQFPRIPIVFKQGNHDERLDKYIVRRAPALFGLEGFDLPSLLHLKDHGVEWVADKRVVRLGKLPVIHGHEYRGGGGVNPARWLYLRARYVAMCHHFHRTSEHHERDIRGKAEAAWSCGCACQLNPRYDPLSNWNHGFAFVRLSSDGSFTVDNRRVLNGKIV